MASANSAVGSFRRFHFSTHIAWLFLIVLAVRLEAQGPKPVVRQPEAKPEKVAAQPSTTHGMTADDVGAFLDGIMPQQLAREDIAGAVVSIVKDGKVLFAKGYGYSDVEKKTLCRQTTHFSVPGPFRSSSPGLR